jgi:hypothetical protein
MIRNIMLLAMLFLAGSAGASSAYAAPGCDDYGRCFEFTIKNGLQDTSTFTVTGGNCYEGERAGTFTLAPGATKSFGIARVQGHGCNGRQGYFSVAVNNDTRGAQTFQFDNSHGLGLSGTSTTYFGGLSAPSQTPGGWVTYTWSPMGTWTNPPLCDSGRCFPLFVKNSLASPVNWTLTPGNCYEGTRPQTFTVQPGQTYQFSLARVQGHGCDGKQGEFSLQPLDRFNQEAQLFNFSNDGSLSLTNPTYTYGSQLARLPTVNGAYQWDVNSDTGAQQPAALCDDLRCFWLRLVNHSSDPAVFSVTGGSCYEGTVGTYKIPAGQQQRIGIARVQGHGCDGHQGNLNVNINGNGTTALNFSNDANMGMSNANPTYDVGLSTRSMVEGRYYYDLTLNGPWQNPRMCDNARCFPLYLSNALATPVTWQLIPGNCYEGTILPQPVTVQPGQRYQISLARVQGHGCDGKQGEFGLRPVGALGEETQYFNFSNDGQLQLSNSVGHYLSFLSAKSSNTAYTHTVDENIVHGSAVVARSTGDWSNPTIKLLNFKTDGFWPNFYQSCANAEVYHNQHVVRLPNDAERNAYFMVAQSREHNGYITLLKVDHSLVDINTDKITAADGAIAGQAIWQHVYTGRKNGNYNPVGNWNHPGKMSFLDGVLVVAAQNWDVSDLYKAGCGYWYSALGTSEDKVLFYDLRTITAPVYLGALTAGQLGVPNHELATVELAYDDAAKKYLLVAEGNGVHASLAADQLSPGISNWTRVNNGPVFSGQHGLAFNVAANAGYDLVYFDASRSNGGSGSFSFTPYTYRDTPPYLAAAAGNSVSVQLPGANRDWAASSIYISPTTQKPIVYTVKSTGDTPNYQLYQVEPGEN